MLRVILVLGVSIAMGSAASGQNKGAKAVDARKAAPAEKPKPDERPKSERSAPGVPHDRQLELVLDAVRKAKPLVLAPKLVAPRVFAPKVLARGFISGVPFRPVVDVMPANSVARQKGVAAGIESVRKALKQVEQQTDAKRAREQLAAAEKALMELRAALWRSERQAEDRAKQKKVGRKARR